MDVDGIKIATNREQCITQPSGIGRSFCFFSLLSCHCHEEKMTDVKYTVAIKAIQGELDYQRIRYEGWVNANHPSVEAELLCLKVYLDKAIVDWQENQGNVATLHQIRKLAAISVRCLANHGAPDRE
jgi:hypothetical protein